MKREIKFRAWDKKSGRWMTTGPHLHTFSIFGDTGKLAGVAADWDGSEDPNDFEISQFTGLKDKNGKEIYESDILQIPTAFDAPRAVEFNVLGHICAVNDNGQTSLLIGEIERCEVIGNIYENPDLLDEQGK